jgi:hypothetical protein
MGKAAETERIRLRATWFNNVSIALFITGILVPYLALLQNGGTITLNGQEYDLYDIAQIALHRLRTGTLQLSDLPDPAINELVTVVAAFFFSWLFHYYAGKGLEKIRD